MPWFQRCFCCRVIRSCSDRCRVGVRNIRFMVSVACNEVAVVSFLLKTLFKYSSSSSKLSHESQTSCAHLVRVGIIIALCEVGL